MPGRADPPRILPTTRTPRRAFAAFVIAAVSAACGIIEQPTPSPAFEFPFQPLVDVGLFGGGPPAVPDPWAMAELPDGTSILVVDRGTTQQVRRVEHDGDAWVSLGGFDAPLLPAGDDGPALRRVEVGPEQGFEDEVVLLMGRIPNGPIGQLELTIDGELQILAVGNRPMVVYPFAAGTELGDQFTTLDYGTHRFDVLPISDAEVSSGE